MQLLKGSKYLSEEEKDQIKGNNKKKSKPWRNPNLWTED
jgi:hypothetical protein